MAQRLQLQNKLLTLTANVYFQPTTNVQMKYPCIVYKRDAEDTKFADNQTYSRTKRYQVTVIDLDPDSPIPDRVAALPLCSFTQHFVADGLNHDVYDLFF